MSCLQSSERDMDYRNTEYRNRCRRSTTEENSVLGRQQSKSHPGDGTARFGVVSAHYRRVKAPFLSGLSTLIPAIRDREI